MQGQPRIQAAYVFEHLTDDRLVVGHRGNVRCDDQVGRVPSSFRWVSIFRIAVVKLRIADYARHLLVCSGPRCAQDDAAEALFDRLGEKLKAAGLNEGELRVKRSRVSCFAACKGGPILCIQPDGTWYYQVTPENMDRIITEHLLGGQGTDSSSGAIVGACLSRNSPAEQPPPPWPPRFNGLSTRPSARAGDVHWPDRIGAQGWRLWSFPDSPCPMALVAHDPVQTLHLEHQALATPG